MAKTKAIGDVLGISRVPARGKAKAASAKKSTRRRRAKGIEVPQPRSTMKRAGVVGGVRGLGR